MKHTISEAAKLAGVSRSTIDRYMKNGRLSHEKRGDGTRLVDTSELEREFVKLENADMSSRDDDTVSKKRGDIPSETALLQQENKHLKEKVEELVKERDREREEYHEREDWLKKKIDTQALLLEDKSQKEEEKSSSDRWLIWGLGVFTLIVGTVAIAAIYYLVQSGAG